MLVSYLVIKCLRYNSPKATGEADNQATWKSLCTCLIDRLQTYIHGQTDPEKGQTSEPLVSFLPGR